MKANIFYGVLFILCIGFCACGKQGKGIAEPQGGLLPTNYIIVTDSGFSPRSYTVTNGNSFTFVNYSGNVKGIYSSDSVIINKQNIANNTSYFFKKDTVGTINFFIAGKQNLKGAITLTP